jgi:hypothetical protein
MLRVDSILKKQAGQFEKILCAVIFSYLFLQQVQQTDNKSTCSTAFEIEIPGTAVKQNMKSLDEVTCCSPALAAKSSLCFTNFGEVHFFRVDDHVSPAVPCTFDLSSGILGCTGGLLGLFGLICTFLGLGLAVSGLSCVFAGGIRGLVGALLGLASGLGLFGLDSLLGVAGSGVACVFVGGFLSFADGLLGIANMCLGRGLAVSDLTFVFVGGLRGLVSALRGLTSGLLGGLDSLLWLRLAGSGLACVFVGLFGLDGLGLGLAGSGLVCGSRRRLKTSLDAAARVWDAHRRKNRQRLITERRIVP